MKIAFDSVLTSLNGKPITEGEKPATLGVIAINALLAAYQDESSLPGTEKARRYALALKLHNGDYDLAVDDLALIKSLIGKAYAPLVVGQAWAFFNK